MDLKNNRDWKDSELEEAVLAYAKMLKMEMNGESYSKVAIIEN